MAEALPGLQQIRVDSQSYNSKYKNGEGEFKYNDGEDPIEVTAADGVITLNIDDLLSKFPKLHTLEICRRAPLNGRYSSLFNFSHLETLSSEYCDLSKFLKPIDVPPEFQGEDLINELMGNLKEMQADFKEIHIKVDQMRQTVGSRPAEMKEEIAQLKQEYVSVLTSFHNRILSEIVVVD